MNTDDEQALIDYSKAGGSLVVSYFTGISNEVDAVKLGGYGGSLVRDHLGVFVDEFAPVRHGEKVSLSNGMSGSEWSQLATTSSADELASYVDGVASGSTALAKSASRRDWYVGTRLDDASNQQLFASLAAELQLEQHGGKGVEVINRGGLQLSIDHNTNRVSWKANV